jgi:DNA-binding winged helix-turn-helix (wHTH) protein
VPLRFGNVEIDRAGREVRVAGVPQWLQPQIWALLDYLLSRRDRVVTKEELLSSLWQGTAVTEGSLQRAVSLARAALGEQGHELLRTFPKQGYRFVAPAETSGWSGGRLTPRSAEKAGVHLAFDFGLRKLRTLRPPLVPVADVRCSSGGATAILSRTSRARNDDRRTAQFRARASGRTIRLSGRRREKLLT